MMERRDPRFIYFIRPVGWDGPVKIGCSIYPMVRLNALMAWSPYALEILATAQGGMGDERRLHQRFAADRLRGEWFRTTRDLLDLVDVVAKTGSLPFEVVGNQRGKLPGFRAVLIRNQISRKQVAAAVGVPVGRVAQWAGGESNGGAAQIIEALDAMGIKCTLAELLEERAPAA